MAYEINPNLCVGCQACLNSCPVGAISLGPDGKCVIDPAKCASCGTCAAGCPMQAISAKH